MNDDTDTTTAAAPVTPAPLLQMLQLTDLPEADGGAPVCGPDGCAVPTAPHE
jgi:hypothetical protein